MCNYSNLSDRELLQIVVMERSGEGVVDDLLNMFSTLPELLVDAEEAELMNVKGIGVKRARQIKAIYELAKRLLVDTKVNNKYKVSAPGDAAALVMPEMRYLNKEYLKMLLLNTKNEVIGLETVSIGSLNSSIVHPREVFNIAIRKSAASIIIYHNHPSGDPTPSGEDVNITNRLKEVGKVIGIDLLDHVIIGNGKYVSLKEKGII